MTKNNGKIFATSSVNGAKMTEEHTCANNNGIATHRKDEISEKNRVKGIPTSNPKVKKKIFSLMSGL